MKAIMSIIFTDIFFELLVREPLVYKSGGQVQRKFGFEIDK